MIDNDDDTNDSDYDDDDDDDDGDEDYYNTDGEDVQVSRNFTRAPVHNTYHQ